jgi:SWI/SNF-related matrix-associated actin-dependent regulator 1 of chromatin subfamily A
MMRKKVIICSDDDDDDDEEQIKITRKTNSSSAPIIDIDDWEQSRDSSTMSHAERDRNIKKAQLERKGDPIKSSKIVKRQRITGDDDNDIVSGRDEDIEESRKIDYSTKSTSALDNSLLEDTPKSERRDQEVLRQKERDHRSKKRTIDQDRPDNKLRNDMEDSEILIIDDEDADNEENTAVGNNEDSDNSDEEDYENEESNEEISKKLLKHCITLGKNLRSHLQAWSGQVAEKGVVDNLSDSNKGNFCTGLMSIKENKGESGKSFSQEILGDEYFKSICPGLTLKAYQLVGVNWVKLLHEHNINGVLADDMGLGKTVQSIAFLAWLKSQPPSDPSYKYGKKPNLIVVPASTLTNWENELYKFCPSLQVVVYHGTQNERADMRMTMRRDIEMERIDVILSTFTIFERESGKDDRSFLQKIRFEYLIIDEAHCLKVSKSARFTNLNALRSEHRLLLSGTPVQNDLVELLSLMSFLMPKEFRKIKISIDELLEGFGWSKKNGASSTSSSSTSINHLRNVLAPFVLRRVKSDVLDQLPDKESFLEKVQMADFQSSVYDNILLGHATRKDELKSKFASEVLADSFMNGIVKGKRKTSADKELLDLTSPPAKKAGKGNDNGIAAEESDTMVVSLVANAHEALKSIKTEDAKKIVSSLSSSEANHLFTALRKAANHPLLLRVRYKDDKVMAKIAEVCFAEGRFGYQCDYQRVRDEIDKFSDFDLHQLCLEFSDSIGHLQLDASVLYDSQKMQRLRIMLPDLQVIP